ncbi:hypothetical protein [Azorhizobium sp. AG788]|uniref:hypothetical protein n=1 Tax=Azorhizobium sp. AG788 TaxID=2183897 RepID=UPI003139A738
MTGVSCVLVWEEKMGHEPDDPIRMDLGRLTARIDTPDGQPAASHRSNELLRMVMKGDEILHRCAAAGIERRLEKIETRLAELEKRGQ